MGYMLVILVAVLLLLIAKLMLFLEERSMKRDGFKPKDFDVLELMENGNFRVKLDVFLDSNQVKKDLLLAKRFSENQKGVNHE